MLGGYVSNRKEFYARSSGGLWVRSALDTSAGAIVTAWQVRHAVDCGSIVRLDENGDEMDRAPMREAAFGEEWVSVCEINLDDSDLIGMAPPQSLSRVLKGLMIHSATMVAAGWGDTAEEVGEWYREPWRGDFIKGDYVVTDPDGPFIEMNRMGFQVDRWEDDRLDGTIRITGGPETYSFSMDDDYIPAWLLMTTKPAQRHPS